MRAGVLHADVLGLGGAREVASEDATAPVESRPRSLSGWDLAAFAEEQIRGLIRNVFSQAGEPPVRQAVFAAVEPETDVRALCRWIGEALAMETAEDIAVVDESDGFSSVEAAGNREEISAHWKTGDSPRRCATRIRKNLWLVPSRRRATSIGRGTSLFSYLSSVRREFGYSIIAAPSAAELSKTLAMSQFADGVILVLSAKHTRRAAALKFKDALAHVRLLGTVLSDREFPMPASIYRRL